MPAEYGQDRCQKPYSWVCYSHFSTQLSEFAQLFSIFTFTGNVDMAEMMFYERVVSLGDKLHAGLKVRPAVKVTKEAKRSANLS